MCTPGRDTKNTEALYPVLQRLEGKHGGYDGQILWVYILTFNRSKIKNGRSRTSMSFKDLPLLYETIGGS